MVEEDNSMQYLARGKLDSCWWAKCQGEVHEKQGRQLFDS